MKENLCKTVDFHVCFSYSEIVGSSSEEKVGEKRGRNLKLGRRESCREVELWNV